MIGNNKETRLNDDGCHVTAFSSLEKNTTHYYDSFLPH